MQDLADNIDNLLTKIDEAEAEQERMDSEAHAIREKMVAPTGPESLGAMVDKVCKAVVDKFDDPLVAQDETVRACRPEVVQITNMVAECLK